MNVQPLTAKANTHALERCECGNAATFQDLDSADRWCESCRPRGPQCSFAQYNRLRLHVSASKRDVIKAAHRLLAPSAKTHQQRLARHDWLRSVLSQHDQSFILYAAVASGKAPCDHRGYTTKHPKAPGRPYCPACRKEVEL